MSTILVTGASDGIGRETVGQLLARGVSHVVLHARSAGRGRPVLEAAARQASPDRVSLVTADFSSLADVAAMARHVRERYPALTVLINNAGVGTAAPRTLTGDGHDLTWQVNYLAPVLLTALLEPLLTASAPARVVNLSSAGHAMGEGIHFDDVSLTRGTHANTEAYCQSKLALVMWTYDLAKRLEPRGVSVNCLHPGTYVDTTMVRQAGRTPLMSVPDGAQPVVALALDKEGGRVTGRYFDRFQDRRSHPLSYDAAARGRLRALTEAALAPFR